MCVCCLCSPSRVLGRLKAITRVMLLFESLFQGVRIGLKSLMTVIHQFTPCLTAFFGGLVFCIRAKNQKGRVIYLIHSLLLSVFSYYFGASYWVV